MKEPVKVYRSRNGVHKFMAVFPEGKTVRFGRKGYSDYTIHKDAERMKRYLTRHRSRESWGRAALQCWVLVEMAPVVQAEP